MPTYVTGDIWQTPQTFGATVIGVPTNAVINRRGHLVMGAGFAKAARERFPWLPAAAGLAVGRWTRIQIGTRPMHQIAPDYGWVYVAGGIGLFQTKDNYRMPSTLDLISYSTLALTAWLHAHPTERVAMPMPGVGLGGLPRASVVPLLASLPHDRVLIVEREEEDTVCE